MGVSECSECSPDGQDFDQKTGLCGFLPEDWYPQYKTVHKEQPEQWLFDARCLRLDPPTDDVDLECRELIRLQEDRIDAQVGQITSQAINPMSAFTPLARALALQSYYSVKVKPRDDLFNLIIDNIRPPTFLFKCRYLRARPFRMRLGKIKPVFSVGDEFYPGHPSYPSGHASQAFTWAYLLSAKLHPDHRYLDAYLLGAARSVARNREWAGLHFASDTRAGESLGKQIAEAILREDTLADEDFKLLMPGLT